ncbi:NAD(P)/FAD-dependent oxidoreductase [Flectobacillus sp. DC10W]|uniref:NADH:ubiquinone reductase (non-electrogenic) n=1 Tax=Flectobacillus longus TaxID=2984207 RepID=A0ABT6YUM1_9BACT|nr:NAD(P)/FAD-dependent oxidoreductase [Flectobacillus longus]MDI9867302.1 NAD(P)/FAD-dependent oxidoreductase [Flectobacillus longus]
MTPNIPETTKKRVVIIGAGFGGLKIARNLADSEDFQIVLIDKNNYHQFQPLFYQVATAGIEPSAISFPLRLAFHHYKDVHVRITEVTELRTDSQEIITQLGAIRYDYLILAIGADTNFFGQKNIQEKALPMKSVGEALGLRNRLLENFENALVSDSDDVRQGLMTVVVVGGGPTGVEVSGTLAEMKRHVLPKDYPELDFDLMKVYIVESGGELLGPMSKNAQIKSKEYLEQLGVNVFLNTRVTDFDGKYAYLNNGEKIRTNNLVWAAGIKANFIEGLNPEVLARGGRIKVNRHNQVEGYQNIFAIGDVAFMTEEAFPNGHPQVAQPAIQQGKLLSQNLPRLLRGNPLEEFTYKDLGSMATVGRNLAVVDLPFWRFQGFFAWLTWMFVHLMSIVGVKNRLLIFINWLWNYITYDQSLRLIIKQKSPKVED